MWWRWEGVTRKRALRQQRFAFAIRRERRQRWFKLGIVAVAVLMIVGGVAGTAGSRYLIGRAVFEMRSALERWIGLPADRAAVDADWKLRRERDVEQTGRVYRAVYAEATPETRRLLDYGGFQPGVGLLRWGNYDRTVLLSSTIFLPDDTGRSYRLRPNTRAIWLRGLVLPRGLSGFFLMPDTLELRQAIQGTGARIVPGSEQSTNSWGCRGPEPDANAPVRGLILGDSFMQGLFIGDDQTPAESLRREIQKRLGRRVSVLNTGHLGYSPEQMFYTLREYGDRFRPHFVVFTFCMNDFGTLFDHEPERRDVDEARYWLDQIARYCLKRNILQISTPIPPELQVIGPRNEGHFPGLVCNVLGSSGMNYCNPMAAFVHEHLRLEMEQVRRGGKHVAMSPLFNGAIGDGHLSALGAALWGQVLGAHVAELVEWELIRPRPSRKALLARPEPKSPPAPPSG